MSTVLAAASAAAASAGVRPLDTACVPAAVRRAAPAEPGEGGVAAREGMVVARSGAAVAVRLEARASFWAAWSVKKKAAASASGRAGSCSWDVM